ncbi:efflux RND transporter permease subunit [Nitratireductor sp. OM-1]|uniref:efflux RND transporter permease subunit n=1 Tax=Nitratireductor sp. OM-1 TaxID=1756988 RepID=UPI000DE0864C|nr:efflux RND transporter permease subunit [Nitratireductor sp. OM-1]
MFLTRISVTHPVFATMMMVVIVVVGMFSYDRLGIDQFPKVDVPVVVVSTAYPGATPEMVEIEVTKRIEDALTTISGIDKLTSRSYEGSSVVTVAFKLEVESAGAAQDVRDKVAAVEAGLPDEADKPVVARYDPAAEPILSVALSSATLSVPELTTIAEQRIVKDLKSVAGVGEVTLIGGQRRQIDIAVDEERLRAMNVGVNEVIQTIRSTNRNRPAGSVTAHAFENIVQVQGRVHEPDEFLDMIVTRRGGAPVYVRDVATVREGTAEPESLAMYNGQTALAIDIVKVQDANTVEVVVALKSRLDALNRELGARQVELRIVNDASVSIEGSLVEVQKTLIEGAALAVAIVFLFLNSWRSTVITGLTLPIAMIGTLAVIDFLGFTLNMLSLLGLTLSIGILVDDAIVVRENITRHLHMGRTHLQAAFDGTNEIGLAVMATTATIIAVFLPVAFMEGMVGRYFYEFGVTVSAAVLISLFVAFTLDPMLSSVWHDPDAQPRARRGPVGRAVAYLERFFERLADRYRHIIKWTLRHRLATLGLTASIFGASLLMIPMVGVEFVPDVDEGQFQINVTAPVNASLEYTREKVGQVEKALREFPEVASVYSTINSGANLGKHRATVIVGLVAQSERNRTPVTLADPIRARMSSIPGVRIAVIQAGIGGGASPIQFSVLGEEQAVIERIASDIVAQMQTIPGLVDIVSSAEEPRTLLSVCLRHEQASDLGVSMADVLETLAPLMGGTDVSTWTDQGGESYDVVVRLPPEQRDDLSAISALEIAVPGRGGDGLPGMVRLDQVAEISRQSAASEIRRYQSTREVLISAATTHLPGNDANAALQALIAQTDLPPGYRISTGGDAEALGKAVTSMVKALIMAVIFIYVVLASQFGSFLQPLAIMVALPLSLMGVLLGLLVAGSTINMFSMIGFIMLMGLVTKNGILLVDYANRECREGVPLDQALIDAGAIRLRPIVMTTLAMIFGMIPLAIAAAGGGAQRAPMAHAVIGGLVSSTILTLIVVPVIISYIESFKHWFTVRSERQSAPEVATPSEFDK